MPRIRISEKHSENDSFTVAVSFDDTDEFPSLTVNDPLTDKNRAKLEWHFEQFVSNPYLKDVEPQEAEKIICDEGEALFAQLFSQPQIYNRYYQLVQNDFDNLVIEISGTPEFHSLHWEA